MTGWPAGKRHVLFLGKFFSEVDRHLAWGNKVAIDKPTHNRDWGWKENTWKLRTVLLNIRENESEMPLPKIMAERKWKQSWSFLTWDKTWNRNLNTFLYPLQQHWLQHVGGGSYSFPHQPSDITLTKIPPPPPQPTQIGNEAPPPLSPFSMGKPLVLLNRGNLFYLLFFIN